MTSTSGTWQSGGDHWRDHRAVAACLRTATLVVPLALSIAAGTATAWSVTGTGTGGVVARTLTRRLLPLASLLRLTLVFPDRAPSRFAMALRSGSVRHLREWARSAAGSDALAEKDLTLAGRIALPCRVGDPEVTDGPGITHPA